MTDVSQYYPPPTSQDLYNSSSKHFAQAKQIYEGLPASPEVCSLGFQNCVTVAQCKSEKVFSNYLHSFEEHIRVYCLPCA